MQVSCNEMKEILSDRLSPRANFSKTFFLKLKLNLDIVDIDVCMFTEPCLYYFY